MISTVLDTGDPAVQRTAKVLVALELKLISVFSWESFSRSQDVTELISLKPHYHAMGVDTT